MPKLAWKHVVCKHAVYEHRFCLVNWPEYCFGVRWSDKMEGPRLKKVHWRKSAQWFALTAEHAKLMVSDAEIAQAFRE